MKPVRLVVAQAICRRLPPLVAQMVRHRIYPQRMAYRDNYPFVVHAQTGSRFKGRTGVLQAYPFSVHGYYDWRNCALAVALCRRGDTIVEIGANIGTETTCYADIVGAAGRVWAFEPLPDNVRSLEETLALHQYRNVTVLPAAVGNNDGTLRFAVASERNNSGAGHLLSQWEKNSKPDTIEVACVTLDSVAERIGRIAMIFMETEGAEVQVLRGARCALQKSAPHIVLEATPALLARAGFSLGDLITELRGLGYEPHRLTRFGLVPVGPVRLEAQRKPGNWLCVHETRRDALGTARKYLGACGLLPCIPRVNPMARAPARVS